MLKIGYFSHTNFSPSETFIYDQVKALSNNADIKLTYVTGEKMFPDTDLFVDCIPAGYSQKYNKLAFYIQKIGQLKGNNGDKLKIKFQKRVTLNALIRSRLPNFDVAYVDFATSGVLLMDYFVKKNISFVVHVHGYDITKSVNDTAYLEQLKKLFDCAAYFVAASEYMKRRLILLGCPTDKIKVIVHAVKSDEITPSGWTQKKTTSPSIIFLGRLTEKKNPIALLHAFKIVRKAIPEAKLSILGNGPLEEEVKTEIKKLNLSDSVTMYGVVNRKKSFPILDKHWIYAQHSVTPPSGDTEGFAISLAEAALHELPVVSTIHNGITENVIDGETGFLVPEYDYEAMAEKIIYLINNVDIAERMGKAGRKHILKLCDPDVRNMKIKNLLFSCKND